MRTPPRGVLNMRLSYWESLPMIGSDLYSVASVAKQFHIFICLTDFFSGVFFFPQLYVNCSFPVTLKFMSDQQLAPVS